MQPHYSRRLTLINTAKKLIEHSPTCEMVSITVIRTSFQPVAESKVSYFFISLEKFVFDHLWAKCEWVSENAVFFFRRFFFPAPDFEWVSEFKLFLRDEKKKHFFFLRLFLFFSVFFWNRVSEWPANFSREIKK